MRLGCCDDGSGEAAFADLGPLVPYTPPAPPAQIMPTQVMTVPQAVMPAPTTMVMPQMAMTAQMTNENPQPDLTPRDLLKPLPSIVDNQPTQIAQCNSFSEWVDQNPLLAAGILLGLAWFTFGKKGA